MKITRKMSPILFGLVAVMIGCSMMGAAISVIVSSGTSTNEVVIGNPNSVLFTDPADADLAALGVAHPTADLGNDYPGIEDYADNINTAEGTIYDTMTTVTCESSYDNMVIAIKITNADGTAVRSTDVSLKECFVTDITASTNGEDDVGTISPNPNAPLVHWVPIHLETYGDYLLGYVENNINGFDVSPADAATPFTFDLYYVVTFAVSGEYTISWEVVSQDGSNA